MPLAMNREVFITCAVTGSGGTQDKSPHVPRSPQQIADSAIAAAKAGAAVVHCHVRDPATGVPSRDVAMFREVTERIRDAEVDVVLNLTAGMGGDMVFGDVEKPLPLKEAGTEYISGKFAFMANSRARSTGETDGAVKVLATPAGKILGAHICGAHGGDLIAELVLAMTKGATIEEVARTCHAHPAMGEAVKEACLDALGRAIHA